MYAYAFLHLILQNVFTSSDIVMYNRTDYSSKDVFNIQSNGTGFKKMIASQKKEHQKKKYKKLFNRLFSEQTLKTLNFYIPDSQNRLLDEDKDRFTPKYKLKKKYNINDIKTIAVNQILFLLNIVNDTEYKALLCEHTKDWLELVGTDNDFVSNYNGSGYSVNSLMISKGIYYMVKYDFTDNQYQEIYSFIIDMIFAEIEKYEEQNEFSNFKYSKKAITNYIGTEEYQKLQIDIYFNLIKYIKSKYDTEKEFVKIILMYSMCDFIPQKHLNGMNYKIYKDKAKEHEEVACNPYFRILSELTVDYDDKETIERFVLVFNAFIPESNYIRLRYEPDTELGNEYIDDSGIFHVSPYKEEISIELFSELFNTNFEKLHLVLNKLLDHLLFYHTFINDINVYSILAIVLHETYFSKNDYRQKSNFNEAYLSLIKLLIYCDVFITIKPFIPINHYYTSSHCNTPPTRTNFDNFMFMINPRPFENNDYSAIRCLYSNDTRMLNAKNNISLKCRSYEKTDKKYVDYYHADLSCINFARSLLNLRSIPVLEEKYVKNRTLKANVQKNKLDELLTIPFPNYHTSSLWYHYQKTLLKKSMEEINNYKTNIPSE